jgi:hypothetical protein
LESEVVACEEYLGVKMPPELRQFVLEHDGPMPEPAWVRIGDGESDWLGPVADFLTVMRLSDPRARRDTIDSYTYASRSIEKLPRHFLCFGMFIRQPSTLLISTAESDYGAIYAWHVKYRTRFNPDQLTRVADGLPAMLDAFGDPPASAAATYPNWKEDLYRVRTIPVFPTD